MSPNVLVIIDEIDSKWRDELGKFQPAICLFKVFINSKGLQMFNISGDYPYIAETTSFCSFTQPAKNLLEVKNPDVLSPQISDPVLHLSKPKRLFRKVTVFFRRQTHVSRTTQVSKVWYKGRILECQRIDSGGKTFLQPIGGNTLRVTSEFVLERANDQRFLIEVI